jgi:AraC-like DNA-binding protein
VLGRKSECENVVLSNMKPKLSFEPHLVVKEMPLPPGKEWTLQSPGWSFLHVSSGAGYWLHPQSNYDLGTGSVLVISERAKGVIRASQLGPVVIHYFRLQPERLSGLVTLGEQQFLQSAATQDRLAVRVFDPSSPISQKFKNVCGNVGASSRFCVRLDLLALFSSAFEGELQSQVQEAATDAKMRLMVLLSETPASELLDMSFADLVQETRCTPRHLSRIFHQVVGMSFRDKQAQVRLMRAQELLATTESKVVEVALESGYQSLSLFNLMFKRRFGTTPARWRDKSRIGNGSRRSGGRTAILRA